MRKIALELYLLIIIFSLHLSSFAQSKKIVNEENYTIYWRGTGASIPTPAHPVKRNISISTTQSESGLLNVLWTCKDMHTYFTDTIKSELDICVKDAIIELPFAFCVSLQGLLSSPHDSITIMNLFINKIKEKATQSNLNQLQHGINSYIESVEKMRYSELLLILYPEIDYYRQAIKVFCTKEDFSINDYLVFNDMIVNYADTILLPRKTYQTREKLPNGNLKLSYLQSLNSNRIKSYLLSKYPIAWRSQNLSDDLVKDYNNKLNMLIPEYYYSIVIITSKSNFSFEEIIYTEYNNMFIDDWSKSICSFKKND